jgi:signal peptidase II
MTSPLQRGFGLAVLLVVAADWKSKFWILNRVALGDTLAVVDGWLYLAHRQNPGIAFSLFADLPEAWRTPLLATLSIGAIVLLLRMLRSATDGTTQFGSVLVTGGAVGNLGDRVVGGSVTDFIHLPMFPYVFNVADTAIAVGGALLIYRMLFWDEAAEQGSTDAGFSPPLVGEAPREQSAAGVQTHP